MSTNTIYSKFFYVYKITNTINNKIYIGVHQSESLNDDYMGSGTLLKRSQQKYGIEHFKKEILFVYDNKDNMYAKERELVNEEFIQQSNNYNLKVGGYGGWDYVNENGMNIYGKNGKTDNIEYDLVKAREIHRQNLLNDIEYKQKYSEKMSNSLKEHYRKNGSHWIGKSHNQITKDKISEISKVHQRGKGNSQYGTMWIHSLEEKRNMKIGKDEQIPEGWIKGRKMKF